VNETSRSHRRGHTSPHYVADEEEHTPAEVHQVISHVLHLKVRRHVVKLEGSNINSTRSSHEERAPLPPIIAVPQTAESPDATQ